MCSLDLSNFEVWRIFKSPEKCSSILEVFQSFFFFCIAIQFIQNKNSNSSIFPTPDPSPLATTNLFCASMSLIFFYIPHKREIIHYLCFFL